MECGGEVAIGSKTPGIKKEEKSRKKRKKKNSKEKQTHRRKRKAEIERTGTAMLYARKARTRKKYKARYLKELRKELLG